MVDLRLVALIAFAFLLWWRGQEWMRHLLVILGVFMAIAVLFGGWGILQNVGATIVFIIQWLGRAVNWVLDLLRQIVVGLSQIGKG